MKITQVPFDVGSMEISPEFTLGKDPKSVVPELAKSEMQSLLSGVTLRPVRAALLVEGLAQNTRVELEVENELLYLEQGFLYADGKHIGYGDWLGTDTPLLFVRLFM